MPANGRSFHIKAFDDPNGADGLDARRLVERVEEARADVEDAPGEGPNGFFENDVSFGAVLEDHLRPDVEHDAMRVSTKVKIMMGGGGLPSPRGRPLVRAITSTNPVRCSPSLG
jgi:hypothetical protein